MLIFSITHNEEMPSEPKLGVTIFKPDEIDLLMISTLLNLEAPVILLYLFTTQNTPLSGQRY
ncbi:MAG: hypothetical protein CM15mP111_0220 [Hyphomicrobiales bacterium]|nr:MAG: hypothetical protein CM15mP111_0220 [Hyphomicrobiales bacterium]